MSVATTRQVMVRGGPPTETAAVQVPPFAPVMAARPVPAAVEYSTDAEAIPLGSPMTAVTVHGPAVENCVGVVAMRIVGGAATVIETAIGVVAPPATAVLIDPVSAPSAAC